MAGKPDIDIEAIRRDIRQANGEGALVRKPLDPATGKEYERCSHALYPGSQMGAYEPELLVKLYDSLHFQMPDTGVIFLACGMAAKEAGDEELYRECLAGIEGAWEELGRPVLLMACPQCMATLRKELPQIETVSLYKKLTEMEISGGCNHDEFILSEDDEDIRTLHHLEPVAVEVFRPEGGRPVREAPDRAAFLPSRGKFALERSRVPAFHLGGQDAQVAGHQREGAGLGLAVGVLPDLEPAAALQVHRYAGVAPLRLSAGVEEHPLGDGIVLEDACVKAEILYEPVPGFPEIDGADSSLLDTGNLEICHFFRF